MATKSKNTKGIKIAAFVMAVVMFLASGFFGSLFIRSFAHYAGDTSKNYFETPSFRWQMNQFITDMFHSAQSLAVSSIEDYQKTTAGQSINQRWKDETEKVSQAFDLLAKSEVRVHRDAQNRYRYSLAYNNGIYYFNYDGNFISAEEFSESAMPITLLWSGKMRWCSKYWYSPNMLRKRTAFCSPFFVHRKGIVFCEIVKNARSTEVSLF